MASRNPGIRLEKPLVDYSVPARLALLSVCSSFRLVTIQLLWRAWLVRDGQPASGSLLESTSIV
jgi:hypothetical protein